MRIPRSLLVALLSLPLTLVGASAQQVVEKVTPKTPSNQTGYRILHTFLTATDGHNPVAGVILDPMGNLYGTTPFGGESSCGGCGIVFKVSRTGVETVLYNFSGAASGGNTCVCLGREAAGKLSCSDRITHLHSGPTIWSGSVV